MMMMRMMMTTIDHHHDQSGYRLTLNADCDNNCLQNFLIINF